MKFLYAMKYDDASWHFDSTQKITDEERWNIASAHIAVYLRCCFAQGWLGELHLEDESSRLDAQKVLTASMTATEFFITHCDCKFTDEDLNREGNAFTMYYFNRHYPEDLENKECINGELLSSTEDKYNYPKIKEIFDQRYAKWLSKEKSATKKPKWKFW